ncbi:MAG TPA: PH domain-containing protein [Candidatus Saccharimonadia bacterium]|nr:PH domain-containing protein [Candidatus Saccharimonadia bacterium]
MDYGFTLDAGEEVIRVIRRSIFDILPTILVSVVLALAAAALAYLLGRYPAATPFPPQLMLLLVLIMAIIAVIIFLIAVDVYRHNLLIFTNVHIVQVEQLALFQRRVSQLNLRRIEDVTGMHQGFLQSIFDFGEVQIQSAGEQEKFIFKNAPHPQQLADEALEKHEQSMRAVHAQGMDAE